MPSERKLREITSPGSNFHCDSTPTRIGWSNAARRKLRWLFPFWRLGLLLGVGIMAKPIVAYYRVSTDRQGIRRLGIEAQQAGATPPQNGNSLVDLVPTPISGGLAPRFGFLAFRIPSLSPEPRLRRSRATVGGQPSRPVPRATFRSFGFWFWCFVFVSFSFWFWCV